MFRFYKALNNSLRGLKYAFQSQWTIRFQLLLVIISVPLAFYLSNQLTERILMIGSVILMLIVELINSAIETTINRISLEHHELSGLAKDMASAAMLFAIINAIIVWSLLLIQT